MSKKERIFESALNLFSRFGLQKVNVQEIADSAGISKKTIYNHFESKEDLFHQVIDWHLKQIVQFYEDLINDLTLPVTDKLVKAISFASKELSFKHSMIYPDLKRINPYLETSPVGYVQKKIHNAIASLINEAKLEGLCRTDYSTTKLTVVLFSMISGLLSWEDSDNIPLQPQELFDASITLILDSLLTDKGKALLPMTELTHNSLK